MRNIIKFETGSQKELIYLTIQKLNSSTLPEIASFLDKPISDVPPFVHDLQEMGAIAKDRLRPCRVTKRILITYRCVE